MVNPRAYLNVMGEVLGDFVDPFEPTVNMTVYYGNRNLISCSELSLTTAQITPMVHIGGENDALYTLVMVNPDAPNPNEPSMREVVSWIVTNIQGGASSAQGTEFVAYEVANPQVGVHRFVMLLYRQESALNEIEPLASRVSFKSDDFAKKHNLGKPLGITYFTVRRQARRNA